MTDIAASPALARQLHKATPFWHVDAALALTSEPRAGLSELLSQLSSLVLLGDDWDGEGSEAVVPSSVRRAYDFVSSLTVDWLPWVAPTTDGGVRVEWDARAASLMIDFLPDGHDEVHFRAGSQSASLRDMEIPDDLGPMFEAVRRSR